MLGVPREKPLFTRFYDSDTSAMHSAEATLSILPLSMTRCWVSSIYCYAGCTQRKNHYLPDFMTPILAPCTQHIATQHIATQHIATQHNITRCWVSYNYCYAGCAQGKNHEYLNYLILWLQYRHRTLNISNTSILPLRIMALDAEWHVFIVVLGVIKQNIVLLSVIMQNVMYPQYSMS